MSDGCYKLFYRTHYLSGWCQGCRGRLSAEAGLRCDNCQLVSYCSFDCSQSDQDEHQEICEALGTLATTLRVRNVFEKAYHLGEDAYREFRSGVMAGCGSLLGRPLERWEQEICLFPPICATCKRFSVDLEVCPDCEEIRWCCSSHKPLRHASRHCLGLQLYRGIAVRQISQLPVLHTPPDAASTPPEDMGGLLGGGGCSTDQVYEALLSDIASAPLSLYHVLEGLGLSGEDNLCVHVVGAEPDYELSNLRKWDDFLFRFLRGGSLTLVFIGPEVTEGLPPRRITREDQGRSLQFLFTSCLYHEYEGPRPQLVCLFNPGIYRLTGHEGRDTWGETVKTLFNSSARGAAPVLITAYTKREIGADLDRLTKTSEAKLTQLIPAQRNPFRSRRPLRNLVSDESCPIVFKNAYYMLLASAVTLTNA